MDFYNDGAHCGAYRCALWSIVMHIVEYYIKYELTFLVENCPRDGLVLLKNMSYGRTCFIGGHVLQDISYMHTCTNMHTHKHIHA